MALVAFPFNTPVKLMVPVPPFATAMVVPLHVPEVIVPTPVKLELTTLLAKVVPDIVPAVLVMVILPGPFAMETPEPAVKVVLEKLPEPVPISICPLAGAVVKPVPPLATAMVVPLHTPLVIVPTPVKLELTIDDFNVVPDRVPASAIILVVLAAVNLPLLSTVNVGIAVDDP